MANIKYKISYDSIATGKREFVRAPNGKIRHYPKEKAARIVRLLKPRKARMIKV